MELKFRAWEPVYEEMIPFDIEDDDVWFEVNAGDLMLMYNVPTICSGSGVAEESDQRSHRGSAIFMQFTGLQDCNGVDIYAGDILAFAAGFKLQRGVIIFHNGSFMFDINKPFFVTRKPAYNAISMKMAEARIIGNIHMNPELLDSNNGNSAAIGDSND